MVLMSLTSLSKVFLSFSVIFNVSVAIILMFCVCSASINFARLLNQDFLVLKCLPISMALGFFTPFLWLFSRKLNDVSHFPTYQVLKRMVYYSKYCILMLQLTCNSSLVFVSYWKFHCVSFNCSILVDLCSTMNGFLPLLFWLFWRVFFIFLIVFLPKICFRKLILWKAIIHFILPKIFLDITDVHYALLFIYNFLSIC